MRDIAEGLRDWRLGGARFAIATVVATWKSAPRQPGAAMAVCETGEVIGSVSGGCVEGAVYELAKSVIDTGTPARATYGVSDDEALTVGLTCGGVIDIFIRPAGPDQYPQLDAALTGIERERPVAVATAIGGRVEFGSSLVVTPDGADGSLGNPELDAGALRRVQGMLAQGSTGIIRLGNHGEQLTDDVMVFVESFAPPPQMLVFGAIDFAGAVSRIGKYLGYHVVVCDARPVFATRRRFPDADELVVDWPHRYLDRVTVDERTVICVLTHDPKFDVPVLERALRTPAGYIGAMGSRQTHADRLERLRDAGVDEASIARLSSPIGLDLGARTPEETAVAIAAEIIALRWGGSGDRLTGGERAIHR